MLQGAVAGARLTSIKGSVPVTPPTNISVGNQTVPFLQFGNLRFPELAIAKTVTTASGTCPGTESLDVQSGDTVKYCYRVTNPSNISTPPGAALYDLTSVTDDNRTPSNTADDFTVALSGLTDLDGDGQNDDLAPGDHTPGGPRTSHAGRLLRPLPRPLPGPGTLARGPRRGRAAVTVQPARTTVRWAEKSPHFPSGSLGRILSE